MPAAISHPLFAVSPQSGSSSLQFHLQKLIPAIDYPAGGACC
jgi:hypothetical protein